MASFGTTNKDGKLTIELKCTELPQFNYLIDLITRYKDQLPQAMIDELSALDKGG